LQTFNNQRRPLSELKGSGERERERERERKV